jgi:serine/threonine protein kinase
VTFLSDQTVARLREVAAWPDLDGRYTITGIAGRGGSATVYVARDERLARDVAIKVLDVADRAGRGAEHLSQEASILARLDHPGIVPVHDRGQLADGRTYYVMKLVRGRRLGDAAADRAELADRLGLFARVLDTVAFAHAHDVVHRDLKPDNILVGSFGEVYVMDWGVAKGAAFEAERLIVGTPGFMPPEQAAANPDVDLRADIFALGAVLKGLVGADPPRPLAAIVRKACAEDPAGRYQNTAELADDLARFRDGRPVRAYREPLADRLLRLYRRYELPILLVLAYVLMRAVLLVWGGV